MRRVLVLHSGPAPDWPGWPAGYRRVELDESRHNLLSLRREVRAANPEVLHAVGPAAVARLPWIARGTAIVASDAIPRRASWPHGLGLKRCTAFVAATLAERRDLERLGVASERIEVVWTAAPSAVPPDASLRPALGLPSGARLIAADGSAHGAGIAAVWGFDVLRYAVPDVYLVIIGTPAALAEAERFNFALNRGDNRVFFVGAGESFAAWAAVADIAWVPHRRGGVPSALRAMAAGVPVAGFATPELTEVSGDAAALVPPGDNVALAGATLPLLDDPEAARRLGESGHRRAAQFPAEAVAERWAAVYDRLSAGRPSPAA